MLLSSLLQIFRQILSFHFFDDISHLDRIAYYRILSCFLLLNYFEHRVFMEQLKILAFVVGYLLLEDVFVFFLLSRFGCL